MDSLKNIASQIQNYPFESCHKSCIVNLEHIKQIKGYEIILKNGKGLRISQKKSSEFRKKMKSYLESTKN